MTRKYIQSNTRVRLEMLYLTKQGQI